jgi:hypothetical protein
VVHLGVGVGRVHEDEMKGEVSEGPGTTSKDHKGELVGGNKERPSVPR